MTSSSAKNIAKLALSKARKLEKKQEVKTHDKHLVSVGPVDAAGFVVSLCDIAQGNERFHRDGNQLSPFFLKMVISWIGQAAATSETYRLIIFRDKQQVQATTPTALELLVAPHPLSIINAGFRKRWKILFDRLYTGSNDANIRLSFTHTIGIKLRAPMLYAGTLSTDITKGGLYFFVTTNSAAGPTFTYTSRLFYNDG